MVYHELTTHLEVGDELEQQEQIERQVNLDHDEMVLVTQYLEHQYIIDDDEVVVLGEIQLMLEHEDYEVVVMGEQNQLHEQRLVMLVLQILDDEHEVVVIIMPQL